MPENRIKTLRKARGLSAQALADLIGMSQGQVSRMENSRRGLSIPVAERIAMALNTTPADVMGLLQSQARRDAPPRLRELAEDAVPYKPENSLAFRPKPAPNIDHWEIKSDAVSLAGVRLGDIVEVDISAETVENVKPLAIVIAQVYDPADLTKAETILRQFVPPSLLITNSASINALPLDLARDEAHVKGVVVAIAHRRLD